MSGRSYQARERIERMVDAGSFVELDRFLQTANAVYGYDDVSAQGEGVIAGTATIDARPVYLFAQDISVLKGSVGAAHAAKIVRVIRMAAKAGVPLIGLWDSQGARVQESAAALNGYASIACALTEVSGVIPTISIAAGDMLGCASLFAALTDFTIAIEGLSAVGVHPPMVLAATEGREVDAQALIGAHVQAEDTGLAQMLCKDEDEAIAALKRLLGFLPSNNLDELPVALCEDDLARPIEHTKDARALAAAVADNQDFFELSAGFAPEMVTGFAMLGGYAVGIVANQPGQLLTEKGCIKAARFVRLLDAFDMPVLTLIDNMGAKVEWELAKECQVRALAKLAYAYAEAGCAKVSVITGRAIGEGYMVMANKAYADIVYAYADAEIACVNAEAGAILLLDGKQNADQFKEMFADPMAAARQGLVDDVIQPENTRLFVARAIEAALNKREQKLPKKHGIMPM